MANNICGCDFLRYIGGGYACTHPDMPNKESLDDYYTDHVDQRKVVGMLLNFTSLMEPIIATNCPLAQPVPNEIKEGDSAEHGNIKGDI